MINMVGKAYSSIKLVSLSHLTPLLPILLYLLTALQVLAEPLEALRKVPHAFVAIHWRIDTTFFVFAPATQICVTLMDLECNSKNLFKSL